ncbi:aldolase/citrate lyase family protein [Brevibacterium sp. 50QC2O2]|jgi:2-keto-3-deoxy-L-rhamnonate aldolase RhmA|uniref:HpcH/HpaI aldolase family protein n=1 Tax=unclassified Brevibacterium TaxID=2614124 RepID=UPI00211B919F|nr:MULTISPECIES: aldolase/citrate lyase family protein [unclassified Brevibacterium]MCQ9369286.1 aldolase/citrate lyase family protein [Brevibacterium sp. 91QC2O2]MCQ9388681.1 aldolase/citrate lyase family protein [Brevibacterium sp. 50QC2O2]
MTTKTFHQQIGSGELSLGTFILEFMTTGVGALTARAGADWVLYDLEHSGYTLDSARAAIAVSRREDIATFVRVAGTAQHLVSTALDAGAEGIMVPYVNSAEQAERIGTWLHYPGWLGDGNTSAGVRGSAFGVAHDLYAPGLPADKQAAANESVVFLPQIETPEAVDAAADIAALEAVTVPFIGPMDLSTNLGAPGDWQNPRFRGALDTVAQACRDAGKAAGIFSTGPELTELALQAGFTVISLSADAAVYSAALGQGLADIRRAAV